MCFGSQYVKEFSVHVVVNISHELHAICIDSWHLCFHNYVWLDKFSTAGVELKHVQISCRFPASTSEFDTLVTAAASSFSKSFF